ncbi:MAG: PKD domain-containing protein, partial [Clostridia bacterium]|nr:PKD domain-containing protein [Clostridia bacterium]
MSSKTKSELNSRIVGSKLWLIWLWLSAGIVCLADIAVLVVLGIEGVQGAVYALPIVFLVLDVIITILSAVTNFRFKRALVAPIVYAVLKLVVVAMAMWMFLGDTVIFSTTAITLWLVFEFFSIACIILSAVFAKGSGHGFLAVVAVFTVAIIAFGAVYMVFVSTSGFFGQNRERTFEKRTLVYSYYDDNRDSLVASDVLDGNGNTIVVPAEFNGMEVKGVDCTLFAQDGVDTVVLRCSEDVEFQNTEELCYMGDDVSIYADPDCIDTYREYFYSLSIDEIEKSAGVSTYSRRSTPKSLAEAYAAFANSMYPEVGDGEDGEDAADNVYVTVEIDYRYLPAFKNGNGEYEIPAVWIAERGSVFDPYEIYGYEYTEHMDEGNEIDLCWCYYNFSNYILTDFTGPDGKSVVGEEISDSVTVSVKMAEIYAVEVGDGNDAVHTEPGLNRDFYGGYRYVTESTADEIMDEVTKRTGFTLSWEYSLSGSETRRAFTTLVGRLSDGMTIYPVWTMEAPKISASADSYTVVYGNTVKFDSDGSFADDGVALAYVWTHGTDTESEKQNFEKENMDPTKDGGTYTVTVTAGGDGITSLTTTASASVYITVNKRNLVLEWSTTSSSVYSG